MKVFKKRKLKKNEEAIRRISRPGDFEQLLNLRTCDLDAGRIYVEGWLNNRRDTESAVRLRNLIETCMNAPDDRYLIESQSGGLVGLTSCMHKFGVKSTNEITIHFEYGGSL